MAMVASTEGSSTSTFWKRRSSAASFSMYLRYSSSVVAPMQCSSPRASAGLSMLPASMAPSALPAPTMVCSSSMKTMMRPSSCAISLDRGLLHEHFLEAALECGVLLDVLAVLVERCRADAVQLAARERRFEHVARVDGAFRLAGPDHGVQLVDEDDDAAFLLRDLL